MSDLSEEPTGVLDRAIRTRENKVRWAGRVLLVAGLAMIPWTYVVFESLPRRALAEHFKLAWGGFDVFLTASLLWTGFNAIRPTRWLSAAASSTATLLFVDAWFDVVTSPRGAPQNEAVLMAVFVELPMMIACLWLTLHAQELRDGTLILRIRRRRRRPRTPAA